MLKGQLNFEDEMIHYLRT